MRSPLHRMRAAAELLAASPESIANDPAALAKLLAAEGDKSKRFGSSVALSADGNTALIGRAPFFGSAYVFIKEADGSSYSQQAKFEPDKRDSITFFGYSISLSADGSTVLIGDPVRDGKGAVYIFTKDEGGGWKKQALITSDDGGHWHYFGCSVSLSADGQTALIGTGDSEFSWDRRPGSAYIFVKSANGTWSQQVKLVPNDSATGDSFGFSVSLSADGGTALIGAVGTYYDDNNLYPGSAYVFIKGADGAWSQQAKLTADDSEADDNFGWNLSLSADGSTALIGASRPKPTWLFVKNEDGTWNQQMKFTDVGNGSLASDGRMVLLGAPLSQTAYLFIKNDDGTWSERTKLTAEDSEAGDLFGASVSLSADSQTALIGAPGDDDRAENAGSAYVFSIPPLGSSAPVAAVRLRQ